MNRVPQQQQQAVRPGAGPAGLQYPPVGGGAGQMGWNLNNGGGGGGGGGAGVGAPVAATNESFWAPQGGYTVPVSTRSPLIEYCLVFFFCTLVLVALFYYIIHVGGGTMPEHMHPHSAPAVPTALHHPSSNPPLATSSSSGQQFSAAFPWTLENAISSEFRLCDGVIYEDDPVHRRTVRFVDFTERFSSLAPERVLSYTCCCHEEVTQVVACNGLETFPFIGYEVHCMLTCPSADHWRLIMATGKHLNTTHTNCFLRVILHALSSSASSSSAGDAAVGSGDGASGQPKKDNDDDFDILKKLS